LWWRQNLHPSSRHFLKSDKASANEAEKLGMVYKVFPDVTFEEESKKLAHTLAQMPTKGLAFTKHALNHSFTNSWEEQLLLEDEFQQKAAKTHDYNEGIHAFLQKRNPNFKGE
jgi:2-(1,2-epoxy-1,2-dihydrophenyl)acetyl-CoA isomerase